MSLRNSQNDNSIFPGGNGGPGQRNSSHVTANTIESGVPLKDLAGEMSTSTPTSLSDEQMGNRESKNLRRALRERHVNMIAFSNVIGIGLFITSGSVLATAGPFGSLLSYIIVGTIASSVIMALGEMTALMPVEGPIVEFASRFLDNSVGFAIGWIYWMIFSICVAAEATIAAGLMGTSYESATPGQIEWSWHTGSPAIWVTVFLVVMFIINMFPVKAYGEIEYVFGCLKMAIIIVLIIWMTALSSKKGGQYWSKPYGPFSDAYAWTDGGGTVHQITGGKGRLLSMWTAMSKVLFQYIGMEIVVICAAETAAQQKQSRSDIVRISIRKILIRIILLYTLSTFIVSFAVPHNDHRLVQTAGRAASLNSPFVLALELAKVRIAPQVLNGIFAWSALTSGVNCLYISSRTLHALACQERVWPKSLQRRLQRTRRGHVPQAAVLASTIPGILAYLSCGSDKVLSRKVFGWFSTACNSGELLVYLVTCLSYIKFYQRLKQKSEQQHNERWRYNRDDERFPFRPNLQPLRAGYGALASGLFLFFGGWTAFLQPHYIYWVGDMIAAYICVVIFLILVIANRFYNGSTIYNFWKNYPEESWNGMEEVDPNPNVQRRGRLYLDDFTISAENATKLYKFIWEWVKL